MFKVLISPYLIGVVMWFAGCLAAIAMFCSLVVYTIGELPFVDSIKWIVSAHNDPDDE